VGRGASGAPGRPNLYQIATVARVSKSTVSNVLNQPQLVAEETRLRVQQVMKELGYVPNGVARQLRGEPSQVAGCMVLDASNPYFADVARGAEDRFAEAGLVMLLCSTDVEVARQDTYLRMLEEDGVRGIVMYPVGVDLGPVLQVHRRGTPVVLLGRSEAGLPLCTVDVDDVLGGRLAAEHVLRLGHRRLVIVSGEGVVIDRRGQGVRDTVQAFGGSVELTEIMVPARADEPHLEAAVDRILAMPERPTAVLCINDRTAGAMLHGLARRGVAVPDDISLVGYDDLPFASLLSPPLTTIRQPRYELGRVAAERLLSEWLPDHRHGQTRFEPELVVRDSTAPPR
jgi:LacI family transcriptional regulator